ncbi:RES family NAD+ phosphorylase [Pedobacter sp. SYP-B3415]|uniref:RES family NAD+ phosphorylase n=1 Tax=Pedobacter sp. SYP-B3415 TaxID=2496641 RepID=UPI00101B9D57|nr:RES domain-containing protein [Pedobacter sp. SYP-B3415]
MEFTHKMRVYRLSKSKYRGDIEGVGAKLYGGRWNFEGTPCIYTSSSRALAVLEFAVHSALELIPRALHMTTYEIDASQFLKFDEPDLPGNWKKMPAPVSTKKFGTRYLNNKELAGICVPSILVPEEYNYLINPESLQMRLVTVIDTTDFVFDTRLEE